ncbi:ribose-phosphate pyrophosphokinase [Buchnera aphidicola (Periphyllus koelreuteriae)]|uniref:ribose-phosphate pyrophosphokinase n=1 Tax=Buchnera aphidicola TaxID=9 RepID=UPI0031B8368C
MSHFKLFSGNSVPQLANFIVQILDSNLGKLTVNKFSDGEISVKIDENVRGKNIFIIQSICSPSNDNLMELIIIIDALKRASAKKITAVIPYFGYSRQDKKIKSARVPITAKIVADFLSNSGIDRILTIDLHSEQIQGFFNIPIDNLYGSFVLLKDMLKKKLNKPIIVSPDIGGVIRAREFAKFFNNSDIAIIDKKRPCKNISKVMNIIGDVKNRDCILIDDIIDTGGTICNASNSLKKNGANKIFAYATHPVFSGNILKNIKNSCLNEIIVCDTIPLSKKIKKLNNIRILTLSKMLAEAINRIINKKSISKMFKYN